MCKLTKLFKENNIKNLSYLIFVLGVIDDSAGDLLQINSNMKALKYLRWC